MLGCVAAALAAAAPVILLFGPLATIAFPVGLLITGAHALVLGVPMYFLLRRRVQFNYLNSALAGLLIGAIPVTIMLLADRSLDDILLIPAVCGALGLLGGLAFRKVVRSGAELPNYSARQE